MEDSCFIGSSPSTPTGGAVAAAGATHIPSSETAAGSTNTHTHTHTNTSTAAARGGRTSPLGMLEAPRILANGIELSIHTCTRPMVREVRYIFPHLKISSAGRVGVGGKKRGEEEEGEEEGGEREPQEEEEEEEEEDEVLIIPTIQKSRVDTVRFGPEVEEEKDRCLEYFVEFARPVCEALRGEGYWADYIDPCSGLPVMTPQCTRPYSEVAGFEHLLRYKTQNAGCCKILLHPRWGSSCYPATIFTTAPLGVVSRLIRSQEGVKMAGDTTTHTHTHTEAPTVVLE